MSRRTKVPFSNSRIFLVNETPSIDYVSLCDKVGLQSPDGIRVVYAGALHGKHFNSTAAATIMHNLQDFRPESDVLMVAGRAFVNFSVGLLVQRLFPRQKIFVMQFDARDENYKIDQIELFATLEFASPITSQ